MLDQSVPYIFGVGTDSPYHNVRSTYKEFLVSTPPSTRTIQYRPNLYQGVGTNLLSYTINIPTCVWSIHVSGNRRNLKVRADELLFSKIAIANKMDRLLYLAPFPNIYLSSDMCHQEHRIKASASIAEMVNAAIEAFWAEPFNNDILHCATQAYSIRSFRSPAMKARIRPLIRPDTWGGTRRTTFQPNPIDYFSHWEETGIFPWKKSTYRPSSNSMKRNIRCPDYAPKILFDDEFKARAFPTNAELARNTMTA